MVMAAKGSPFELLHVAKRDENLLIAVGSMVQDGMLPRLLKDGGHMKRTFIDRMSSAR